jgi:hypothetical protein
LGSSAGSYQEALATQLEQIDGSGKQLAAFASTDLEQIVVGEPKAEPNQESECAIEHFFNRRRFTKHGWGGGHELIVAPGVLVGGMMGSDLEFFKTEDTGRHW